MNVIQRLGGTGHQMHLNSWSIRLYTYKSGISSWESKYSHRSFWNRSAFVYFDTELLSFGGFSAVAITYIISFLFGCKFIIHQNRERMYRIGKCILCVTYLIQSANNRYQQQLHKQYDTKHHEYDSINEPK